MEFIEQGNNLTVIKQNASSKTINFDPKLRIDSYFHPRPPKSDSAHTRGKLKVNPVGRQYVNTSLR